MQEFQTGGDSQPDFEIGAPVGADSVSNDAAEAVVSTLDVSAVRIALGAAWGSVLVGLVLQFLVSLGRSAAGADWPGIAVLAEAAQSVSWAVLVCVGLAIGTVAARSRSLVMGAIGAVSGPLAWGLAKGVQRGVQALLGVAVDQLTPFFYLVCLIKGVEYAVLGAALGGLTSRAGARLRAYLSLGLAVGLAAAGLMLALQSWNAAQAGAALPLPKAVGIAVGELMFPICCSLVIWVSASLKRVVGVR